MLHRILYIQFTDPSAYPPLEHSSVLLAQRGWEVTFLGVGHAGDNGLELPHHPRIRVRRMRFVKRGWAQKLQYVLFFFWTLWWTWRWQPQWIYASDPFSCLLVWWIRNLISVRVVYHEHDLPTPSAQTSFMKLVLGYRRKLAHDAEVCVLPQQARLCNLLQSAS